MSSSRQWLKQWLNSDTELANGYVWSPESMGRRSSQFINIRAKAIVHYEIWTIESDVDGTQMGDRGDIGWFWAISGRHRVISGNIGATSGDIGQHRAPTVWAHVVLYRPVSRHLLLSSRNVHRRQVTRRIMTLAGPQRHVLIRIEVSYLALTVNKLQGRGGRRIFGIWHFVLRGDGGLDFHSLLLLLAMK